MSASQPQPHRILVNRHHWNGQAAHLRSTLMTWEWRWKQAATSSTIIDFSQVEFMEPWALAMFCAFARRLKVRGANVALELDPANPCNQYLEAMGLRDVVDTGESSERWDQSTQNTGLHVLRTHPDVTRFIASAEQLGFSADSSALDALKYSMAELGRNVVQHAESEIGGIAIAQRFPDRREVQVAICDCGRGVFASLQHNYPELRSHIEALRVAVLPHASGAHATGPYWSSDNAGLGLFICKEISHRSGGSFWLGSNNALLGVQGDETAEGHRLYRRINSWEGTLVVMHFPEELMADFEQILDVCRNLARQARTDPSEAGLEFSHSIEDVRNEDQELIDVGPILENVEEATKLRQERLLPLLETDQLILIDFGRARFVTQSFVHALLHEVFRVRGSLSKLIFLGCTPSTKQAIRLVAAYSTEGYRQNP